MASGDIWLSLSLQSQTFFSLIFKVQDYQCYNLPRQLLWYFPWAIKTGPVLSKTKANVKTTMSFNKIRLEQFGLDF